MNELAPEIEKALEPIIDKLGSKIFEEKREEREARIAEQVMDQYKLLHKRSDLVGLNHSVSFYMQLNEMHQTHG